MLLLAYHLALLGLTALSAAYSIKHRCVVIGKGGKATLTFASPTAA